MDSEFNGLQNCFLMPGVSNLQILLSLGGKIVREFQLLQVQVHTNHPSECPPSDISWQFLLFQSCQYTGHAEGKKVYALCFYFPSALYLQTFVL